MASIAVAGHVEDNSQLVSSSGWKNMCIKNTGWEKIDNNPEVSGRSMQCSMHQRTRQKGPILAARAIETRSLNLCIGQGSKTWAGGINNWNGTSVKEKAHK